MATPPPVFPGSPAPPVYVEPKRGMGCFGIGCIVVLIALLLLGGVIAGLSWYLNKKVTAYTSNTPKMTESFDGGDTVFNSGQDKLNNFQEAQSNHQPGSLVLTAEEINTMLARNPDLQNADAHVLVSMPGDHLQIQASIPTSIVPLAMMKDRFVNVDADLSLTYDGSSRNFNFQLYRLKLGDVEVAKSDLSNWQSQLNPAINLQIQHADAQHTLDRVQSIKIHDGKLDIETR